MSNDNDNNVPEGMPTFEQCPDWGKGGQYIYDPETNTRTRVGAAVEAPAEVAADLTAPSLGDDSAAQAEASVASTTPPKKEKARG